jgi:polar amino acid transport system substrate-binding protein
MPAMNHVSTAKWKMRTMPLLYSVLLCTAVAYILPETTHAADAEVLRVATLERKPMSYEEAGEWMGITIELLRRFASETNYSLAFTKYESVDDALASLVHGENDIAAANITITEPRESMFDFTHRYVSSGLQIAVPTKSLRVDFLKTISESGILTTLGIVAGVIFCATLLIWLFEHQYEEHETQTTRRNYKNIERGFWWAFSNIFGGQFSVDSPHSKRGNVLTLLVTLFGVFSVSIMTAQFSAALTNAREHVTISGLQDLQGRSVGVIPSSTAERMLTSRGVSAVHFAKPAELYDAVADGSVDAVLYDALLLRYQAEGPYKRRISLVGVPITDEGFGIATYKNPTLYNALNALVLKSEFNGYTRDVTARYISDKK